MEICLYYTINKQLQGMLAVYVDDNLVTGKTPYQTLTDEIPQTFECKPSEYPPFLFAGINFNKTKPSSFLGQNNYTLKV